jgi:hypothetical protein
VLGKGVGPAVYQVCNISKRCYALKIVEHREAEISRKASQLGIGPKVYDIITSRCLMTNKDKEKESVGLLMEKLDGDIGDFFPFDEKSANIIIPQVLWLIWDSLQLGWDQRDPKMGNFLYKKEGGDIKIYMADYGMMTNTGIEDSKEKRFHKIVDMFLNAIDDFKSFDDPKGLKTKGIKARSFQTLPKEYQDIFRKSFAQVLEDMTDDLGLKDKYESI